MTTATEQSTPEYHGPAEVSGAYRDMLVRLMSRQLYAETATAEVFGRAVGIAPTWPEKYLAAEFAYEEARHSQMLCELLEDLGEDSEAIISSRPDVATFWHLNMDDWINIAVFNFTVDRAGSQQIMEYQQSSYRPWAERMGEVLADEEDHYGNGVENLREIAKDPARLAEFQAVFDELLPNTIKRAFGHPSGPDNDFCLENGLKRHSTEQVVNRYLEEMRGMMAGSGLRFPPLSNFERMKVALEPSTRDLLQSAA